MELGLPGPAAVQAAGPGSLEKYSTQSGKLLHTIEFARLVTAGRDPDFLREYDVTMKGLDRATHRANKALSARIPGPCQAADRLFFRRIRSPHFPADLFRRAWHSRR